MFRFYSIGPSTEDASHFKCMKVYYSSCLYFKSSFNVIVKLFELLPCTYCNMQIALLGPSLNVNFSEHLIHSKYMPTHTRLDYFIWLCWLCHIFRLPYPCINL